MANAKKIIKAVKSAKKAAERAKTNAIQKNSVKVKKNSMDIVSKGLGNKTIRQEIDKFKNIVNDAGLKNARSKGPKPSVKVKPAAKPKANPSNSAKTAFKFDSSYKRAANKSIYKKGN
jgi:hypothetical protein